MEEIADASLLKIFKIMTALYFSKERSFFIVFSSDSLYQNDENKKAYHSIRLSNQVYYQLFDNFS
ncbi:hypothetical protein, partial [Aggregatibacter segnis]|uniref:hypothetical protein n=1 Tax=Aggregatibacter segnis TaxID=739 RepID=UPI0028E1CA79